MPEKSTLKMRFKLNQMEFELEGDQEVVVKEFESFKSFITVDLLPQMNTININDEQINSVITNPKLITAEEVAFEEKLRIPSLKEIDLKGLAKTETDWLLIYCFHASNSGTDTFDKEAIKNLYEQSGRKTKSRMANLSNNIKSLVQKDYIGFYNDEEFIMKPEGEKYLREVWKGNSQSKSPAKAKRGGINAEERKPSVKSTANSKKLSLNKTLNLRPEGKESLKDFILKYNLKGSNLKYVVVIVHYLKEILNLEEIGINDIYTAFEELNLRVPKRLDQTIIDAKTKKGYGWLDYDNMNDIKLSVQGRNAVKLDWIKK